MENGRSAEMSRPRDHSETTPVIPAEPTPGVCWPLYLLSAEEWCKNPGLIVYGDESQVTRGYANSNKNDFFAHAKDLVYFIAREKVP